MVDETSGFTLAPTPNATDGNESFALSTPQAIPQVPDPIATDRALKATQAYPQLGLNTDEIVNKIRNGGEAAFRSELAANVDYQNSRKASQVIYNLSQNLGRPLSLPEALMTQDILKKKQADPNTVIEEGYAEKFMENLRDQAIKNPDSDIGRAFKVTPTQVEKDLTTSKGYFASRQWWQTQVDNSTTAYNNQTTFGAAADWAKGLTGLYESAKLRGLNPNTSVLGEGGLGQNLEAQARAWFHLPTDEMVKVAGPIMDKLRADNPQLAQYYASAMLEQSQSEQLLHSVMPVLDVTIAGDVYKGGKALVDGLRGIAVTRKAIKQVMTDLSKATPENAANAVGDAAEAGIQQASASILTKLQGIQGPVTEELKSLQSIFNAEVSGITDLQIPRTNKEFIGPMPLSATGRSIGQEAVNRINESLIKYGDKVFSDIEQAMKIDQVPAAFAVRNTIQKIVDATKRDYPGWENAIIDTRFTHDGLGNLRSETYFGKSGTALFGTEAEAAAAVRDNFNKLGGARIVQTEGPPQAVKKTVKGKPGPEPIKNEPAEPLVRSPHDVFTGELDDRELRAATTGKDAYNKRTLYPDLGHTMEIDDRIPGAAERRAAETRIEMKGAGYVIVHSAPVDITSPEMRLALLSTNDVKTPMSTINAMGGWLGRLRTPEDTLSREQNLARKIATYAPGIFRESMKDLSREIDKELPKWKIPLIKKNQVWKDWKTVLDYAMTLPDPVTGKTGTLSFRSTGELGDLYLQKLNRVPSPAEVRAAFLAKSFNEFEEAFNKIREFNRQTRLGAETWTFKVGDVSLETNRNTSGGSYPDKKITANGIIQHEFPAEGNILVLGFKEGDEVLHKAQSLNASKYGETLRDAVAKGHGTLVRLTDKTSFPMSSLSKVGDQLVEYVYQGVSESGKPMAERGPLKWDLLRTGQIPRYDYDHYVVQPNLHHDRLSQRVSFLGDNTIAAFQIRAMSKDVAMKLNEIRKKLAVDDVQGAKDFHATSGLEQPWDEVHSWFHSDVSPEGLPIGPKLNKSEDIVSVPHGKTSLDMGKDLERKYGDRFQDATKEYYGHLLDDRRDPFDVFTYKNAGSKDSPLYQKTAIKYIDPLTTLNRGMSRAINGMYLDTYKQMSVEHWIQEAKEWLTVSDKQLASAPEYWFYTAAAENHWKAGAPEVVKSNLINANMQIRQFLGIQDKMDTWLHQTAQTIADSIYGYKPEWALVPNYLLPRLRDPFDFVRGMAYHTKMGLFAIPQLIVQASTYGAIFGIAGPDKASAGAKAALFHMWSRVNSSPEILDHLDSLVSGNVVPGSKWLPGEWKEANSLLRRSGMEHVGNEHIFRDSTNYYDFFGSKFQGFLDAGTWPFREGERQVRTGAFYTAYREVRDELTHTGPLTAAEERAVLNRADLLTINMSRASASALHKGIFSVPMQFMSYTLRMSELIWGQRLTNVEKARLFATYSTLYGVPAAFGLSGLPLGDVINKWSQESGYVTGSPENSFFNNAITEGLPALGLSLISGNWYNVGERYANPGGISVVKDVIRGDKSFLNIVVGAPWSIASNVYASVDPFLQMTLSAVRGDGAFKPKVEDFADIFKEVNSAYSALRFIGAMNSHRWLNKNEGYVEDVSTANAFFMTVTGMGPAEMSSLQTKAWTREQEKAAQDLGIQRFVKEAQRSYDERSKGNVEQADDYMRRAWTWMRWGGVPPDRFAEAISMSAHGYETVLNRTDREYYTRHVSPERIQGAIRGYDQTLQKQYGTQ